MFKDKDDDSSEETINDMEFNLAIKEDGNFNNQANNLITGIYAANSPKPTAPVETDTATADAKKSNLKTTSMFDDKYSITQEEYNNRKRVKFAAENQNAVANDLIKKRKLPGESDGKSKSAKASSSGKMDLIKYDLNLFLSLFIKQC